MSDERKGKYHYTIEFLKGQIFNLKLISKKGTVTIRKFNEKEIGILAKNIIELESVIRLLQQKPEIDEKYVEGKVKELRDDYYYDQTGDKSAKKFITQIISDVRGGGVKMTRDDVDSFIRLFATFRGEERQQALDIGSEYLREKRVEIK